MRGLARGIAVCAKELSDLVEHVSPSHSQPDYVLEDIQLNWMVLKCLKRQHQPPNRESIECLVLRGL